MWEYATGEEAGREFFGVAVREHEAQVPANREQDRASPGTGSWPSKALRACVGSDEISPRQPHRAEPTTGHGTELPEIVVVARPDVRLGAPRDL